MTASLYHASPRLLRVGVIGTGFGGKVQVPAFAQHPRVRVVAVCSGRLERARALAERHHVPLAVDDHRALCEADLDLVVITTPPHLHHPMASCALAAGKHVLCEKPMALSVAEAADLLHKAEAAKVVHLIDHELRLNPNRRKLRDLIAAGTIGRPRHALLTAVFTGWADPARPATWWTDARCGGGALGAYGSHQIDLLRFVLGQEVRGPARGVLAALVPERPASAEPGAPRVPVTADDYASFSLRFDGGAEAALVLSAVGAEGVGPRLEIWGEAGSLTLDSDERLWCTRGGQREDLSEPETLQAPPGSRYHALWALSFQRLVDHLVRVILDGEPVAPAATFQDGLAVQRVLDDLRGLRPTSTSS